MFSDSETGATMRGKVHTFVLAISHWTKLTAKAWYNVALCLKRNFLSKAIE